MSDTTSLNDLKEFAIEQLREYAEDGSGFYQGQPHDAIHEIADSHVPIYNGDLLQMGSDNWELMTTEPDLGPAFDGKPTPINIIAANIYEALQEAMWQDWHDNEDAYQMVLDGEARNFEEAEALIEQEDAYLHE